MKIYLHFFPPLICVLLQVLMSHSKSSAACSYCSSRDEPRNTGVGIDFTLDYVTTAVSFAGGTTVGLAKVEGTPEYKSLMRTWLQLSEQVNNGTKRPYCIFREDERVEREYEDQYYPWYHNRNRVRNSWPYWIRTKIFRQSITFPLAPDRWQTDSSVSTLVSMIRIVEDATEQILRAAPCPSAEAIVPPVLSRAKLVVPSFFFTAQPPTKAGKRHRFHSHDQDLLDDHYPDMYSTRFYDHTHWHTTLTKKFGIALRRALRGSNNLPCNDNDDYDEHYDIMPDNYFRSSTAAPSNALTVALSAAAIDTCSEHGLPPNCSLASTPPVTALAVSFSAASLSLFISRFGGSPLSSIPDSTFPDLGASALSSLPNAVSPSTAAFWEALSTKIKSILSSAQTRESLGDIRRVLLIGDAVDTPHLKAAVEEAVAADARGPSIWLRDPLDPIFAAAIGAATLSKQEWVRVPRGCEP